MREIKFRVWDKIGNSFIKSCGHCIRFDTSAADILGHQFSGHVKDYTIQQYTGLKDKNGKEIYEGDIISIMNYNYPYDVLICEIKYSGAGFAAFHVKKSQITPSLIHSGSQISSCIMGNIFENPELLEKSKQ